MQITIKRYAFGRNSTGGLLFIDGKFECYTVEDQEREAIVPLRAKIPGETAIPRGSFNVELRPLGGFHERYQNRYGKDFHKGMLHIRDVPNFKYILFHSGNDHTHTEGCILVGNTIQTIAGECMIPAGKTRVAYKHFYPKVRDALLAGDQVRVTIDRLAA